MFFDSLYIWQHFLTINIIVYTSIALLFALYITLSNCFNTSIYIVSPNISLLLIVLIFHTLLLLPHSQKQIIFLTLIILFLLMFLLNILILNIKNIYGYIISVIMIFVLIGELYCPHISLIIIEIICLHYATYIIFSHWFSSHLPVKLITSYLIITILSGVIIYKIFNDYQEKIYFKYNSDLNNINKQFEFTVKYFKNFLNSSILLPDVQKVILNHNSKEGHFIFLNLKYSYKADNVYFIDRTGRTVIASNWSFYNKNYGFRPYFTNAIKGQKYIYIARGITTNKLGIYFSYPVYNKDNIIGVLVFKYNFSNIFSQITKNKNLLLLHSSGLVLYGDNELINSCINCNQDEADFLIKNHLLGAKKYKIKNYYLISRYFICSNKKINNNCKLLFRIPLYNTEYFIGKTLQVSKISNYKNIVLFYWALFTFIIFTILLFEVTRWYKWISTDPMTNLLNRRTLFKKIEEIIPEIIRNKSYIHFLMIDIDKFKKINDKFGHQTGDSVIKHLSEMIINVFRAQDILGRYGGEEFLIVFESNNPNSCMLAAERIRKDVIDKPLISGKKEIHFTISVGCYTTKIPKNFNLTENGHKIKFIDECINKSDQALYVAKQSGRNCSIKYNEALVKTELPQQT